MYIKHHITCSFASRNIDASHIKYLNINVPTHSVAVGYVREFTAPYTSKCIAFKENAPKNKFIYFVCPFFTFWKIGRL